MLVKGFILGYMQILLTSLLNIKHAAFGMTIDRFSYILSFFGLAFCIIGYGIFIAMTVWYKSLPSWKKAEWKYILFFRDIDKTDARKYFFYVVFLAKKTAFALIIVFLNQTYLMSHNFIFIFPQALPLLYMIFYRPFELRLTNIHMIYNEMNEIFVID